VALVKRQIFSLIILYKRKNKKRGHGEPLTLPIEMGTSLHNKFQNYRLNAAGLF
jgi:hypothetical protein